MTSRARVVTVASITAGAFALEVAAARPAAADIPGQGIVENVIGGATGWAWDKVTDGITDWVLGAVDYFVDGVVNFLLTAADADVQAVWFSGADSPYATVRAVAAVLLVGFALLAVIQGLLRGDAGMMLARVAGAVPAAVLAMVATTAVVGHLLAVTDALSAMVLDPAGGAAGQFFDGVRSHSLSSGGFAVVLVALVAVLGALLLWVELLVRSAVLYLLVALSPLAFAAMVWPAARGVARRLGEMLLAVIVSKLVICISIAVGAAALGGAGTAAGPDAGVGDAAARGLGALLVGAAVLGLSAASPFVVLRLFPAVEAAAVASGVSRAPVRTAVSAYYLGSNLQRLAAGKATGSGGSQVIPEAIAASGTASAAYRLGAAAAHEPPTGEETR